MQYSMWSASDLFFCPKTCVEHKIEGSVSIKDLPGTPSDESLVIVYFSSLDSEVSREITLFGTTSIIASVGGSLGLFLGFSCLEAALTLAEKARAFFG